MTTTPRDARNDLQNTDPSGSRTCAHDGCECAPTDPHSDHCSAYCANLDAGGDRAEDQDAACACGHAACAQAQHESASDSTSEDDPEVVTAMGHRSDAR